jgi:hypothetical protein
MIFVIAKIWKRASLRGTPMQSTWAEHAPPLLDCFGVPRNDASFKIPCNDVLDVLV